MFSFCFFRGASCCDSRRSLFLGCTFHDRGFFRSHYWCLDLPSYPFHCVSFWSMEKFTKKQIIPISGNLSTLSQATFPPAPWTFAPPKLWVLKSWTSPQRISGCLEFERNLIQSQTRPTKTRKTRGPGVCWVFIVISWLKHTSPASFWKIPRFLWKKVGDLCWSSFRGFFPTKHQQSKRNELIGSVISSKFHPWSWTASLLLISGDSWKIQTILPLSS